MSHLQRDSKSSATLPTPPDSSRHKAGFRALIRGFRLRLRSLSESGLGAGRGHLVDTPERDVAAMVGLEQVLNALTPLHRRNPASAQRAIDRDGYAVYDGPAIPARPANVCAGCGRYTAPGVRWCSRACFTREDRYDAEEAP